MFKKNLKIYGNIAQKYINLNRNVHIAGTSLVQIAFPFKYLNNVWRAVKIPLLVNCFISDILGARTFAITDTKRYVPIIKSSTQDNTEKLQQLKSGIK